MFERESHVVFLVVFVIFGSKVLYDLVNVKQRIDKNNNQSKTLEIKKNDHLIGLNLQ